jgi:hypothetical protein
MTTDKETALNKAKLHIAIRKESAFISTILFSLKFSWDETIPTACTNGINLRVNPEFFLSLPLLQQVFLLEHESYHVAFMHMTRTGDRDFRLWNMATDYVINLMLVKANGAMIEGGLLDKKYDTELCLFETTSLYGNIKGASMYDGMKPFLRYKGDTVSSFLLTLGEEIYVELKEWFTRKNGGEELIHKAASSRKLKMQTKMVGIIKSSLKDVDTEKYNEFYDAMKAATQVTTQKRFYMGEYGYSNTRDVLLGKTEVLEKAENFDRFELENIILWWKKNATKRYNNVVADGRVRKELEVWNQDTMDKIDIIR